MGWNGIELMIMAPCTTNGHAQNSFSEGVKLFINNIHLQNFFILSFEVCGAQCKERCRNDVV